MNPHTIFEPVPTETMQVGKSKLVDLTSSPDAPLTFGVEIEFVIASISAKSIDPHEKDSRQVRELDGGERTHSRAAFLNVQMHVVKTLVAGGYTAVASLACEEDADGYTNKGQSLTDINYWTVAHDSSIQAPGILYDWYSIELKSPPMPSIEASIEHVKNVVNTLTRTYGINTNRSCGIHIHVGHGTRGLELDALRNLIAHIWTFEPQLMRIHPRHRTAGNVMCPTLWDKTILGYSQAQQGRTTRAEGLEQLIAAPTFGEILRLAGSLEQDPYYRTAYEFVNLIPPFAEPLKRTIEFRQHEGTMDAERIERWLRVCIGLVRYARETPRGEVEEFCRGNVDKSVEDCPLSIVLTRLQLEDCGLFYQTRIIEDEGRPEKQKGDEDWRLTLWPVPLYWEENFM